MYLATPDMTLFVEVKGFKINLTYILPLLPNRLYECVSGHHPDSCSKHQTQYHAPLS